MAVDQTGHSRFGVTPADPPLRFKIITPEGLEAELDIKARGEYEEGKEYIDSIESSLFWTDENGRDGLPPGGRYVSYHRLNLGGNDYHSHIDGAREALQQDLENSKVTDEKYWFSGPFDKNVPLGKWTPAALAEQFIPSINELTQKVEDGSEKGTKGNQLRLIAMHNWRAGQHASSRE